MSSAPPQDGDPYDILNVPRSATASQIKSAYRKLALRYHPDKQTTEEEKARCGTVFAKIGNAYEILRDEERRAEYDRFGTVSDNDHATTPNSGTGSHRHGGHDLFSNFYGFGGEDPFQSDFFPGSSSRGRRHPHHFMDPFDLFREVFGNEFGHSSQGFSGGSQYSSRQEQQQDHFSDPFGDSMFGGGLGGMMARQMNMMNSMHSMNHFGSDPFGQQGMQGGQRFFSSSSSSFGGGGGGTRESVSTTTRIINGKRQTVTERTLVRPDGSVETHTETSGDDDFPAMINNGRQSNHAFLQNGEYQDR